MNQTEDFEVAINLISDADFVTSSVDEILVAGNPVARNSSRSRKSAIKLAALLVILSGGCGYLAVSSLSPSFALQGGLSLMTAALAAEADKVAPALEAAPVEGNGMPLPPSLTPAGQDVRSLVAPEAAIKPPAAVVEGASGGPDPLAWSGAPSLPSPSPALSAPHAAGIVASPVVAPAIPSPVTPVSPAVTTPSVNGAVKEVFNPSSVQPEDHKDADLKIGSLEARLATLEKDLSGLQSSLITKADFDDLKQAVDDLQKQMKAENQKAATEPKVKKTSKVKLKPVLKLKPAASSRWILKSASPGVAWVARPGSSELRAASVGTVLPGIGKVTSIGKNADGKWVLSGTQAKIIQTP
jgi:hypothetical protein